MLENIFQNLVKKNACKTGIKYLQSKQSKGDKASSIKHELLELQDYLNPCSNITLTEKKIYV